MWICLSRGHLPSVRQAKVRLYQRPKYFDPTFDRISPIALLGLPIGAWALAVLSRPGVVAAFEAVKAGRAAAGASKAPADSMF